MAVCSNERGIWEGFGGVDTLVPVLRNCLRVLMIYMPCTWSQGAERRPVGKTENRAVAEL